MYTGLVSDAVGFPDTARAPLSAWRSFGKAQKAEDGWLQRRVLTENRTVTVTAVPCRGHSSHRVGHEFCMYGPSCSSNSMRRWKKIIKESSQENSNNFYCTFLFGLERTFQLVLLLRPLTNTHSQELDEVSQSDWWQVRCAHSFYSWDLKHKETILILDLWLGELEVQIVAALSQIQGRDCNDIIEGIG